MAGTLTMTPDPVDPGGEIDICFDGGSAMANDKVKVDLSNGGAEFDEVDIQLDGDGEGCVTWTVPTSGWASVIGTETETSASDSVAVNP